MNIFKLFDKPKIIGLVGNPHSAKSNLIYWLLTELKKDFKFNVYVYGLRCEVQGTKKINSIEELEQITNSFIIVDEMFSLFDLENRKIKAQIENTLRLIFHNNNILLLCGLGENFKKFLSAKIREMIYKKITFQDLINGSNVKKIIMNYKGSERGSTMLNLGLNEAIFFDGLHYHKIEVPYLPQFDSKKNNVSIFVEKTCKKK